MNHRKFVVASTVLMLAAAGIVAGLAFYSNFSATASISKLPAAVGYLPRDVQAVFGMNVQKFVASPVYAQFQKTHGEEIGKNLAEFIAKTGVDPTKDVLYVVAGGSLGSERKGTGVVIAVATGRFNKDTIVSFIKSQVVPIPVDYDGATVLMIPEKNGEKLEKGIAFLSDAEIALGDLDSLKAVLDVRFRRADNISRNPTLGPLIDSLNPTEMFWFAGDAASILSKAPAQTNTPLGGNISAIVNVVGTLNLDDAVRGKITVTAKDKASAGKLADVARGFIALGQLATEQDPNLTALLNGVSIATDAKEETKLHLVVNFPFELLEKLEHARPRLKKV